MLTDHLPNGDGQIAYGFLSHLAENGHEVHIVTARFEVRGELHPNLHIYVLKTNRTGPLGRLEYMVRMRRLFTRLRRTITFDLIHQTNPVFAGVSLALLGSGLPLVLGTYVARWPSDPATLSGGGGFMGRLAGWARDFIAAVQQYQADILLVTVPAALNRMPLRNAVRHKVRWIGHGVDSDFFSPAQDYLSDDRMMDEQCRPSVLFLANVSKRKGIETLVAAWPLVLAHLPAAKLCIAGDGPDLPHVKELAIQLGIGGSVHFAGHVPRSRAPDFYRAHALYVLPSSGEPYATSLLEAMSCGRPIVTTDTGGSPQLVAPGGGLHIPERHPESLAAALLQLLQDPEQRCTMARTNREHVLESMTWPSIIHSLESYYSEVLR